MLDLVSFVTGLVCGWLAYLILKDDKYGRSNSNQNNKRKHS